MTRCVVVAAFLLITSCSGDSDSGARNSSDQRAASLAFEETEHAARFKLDASASTLLSSDRVEQVSFEITDADTNERVAREVTGHHSEPVFLYLAPGSYNVTVSIEVSFETDDRSGESVVAKSQTTETLTDGVYIETESSYTAARLDEDGNCWLNCSTYDEDNQRVGCTFDFDASECSDLYSLAVGDLLAAAQFQNDDIDESYDLCIRAFGAAGAGGGAIEVLGVTIDSGGSGGDGGVAQTVITYADLADDATDLYFLLGYEGSSSIVTTVDFSSSTSLDSDGVLAVAGGGGGGGGAFLFYPGVAGGDGAMASSETKDECVFAQGNDGSEGDTAGDPQGGGGGSNATGECTGDMSTWVSSYAIGSDAYDNLASPGSDGFGGLGSSWFNASDFTESFGGDGNGGAGYSVLGTTGGAGGAGAGGGQGAYGSSGGGGGGSYARAANKTTSWCNDDYYAVNPSSYGNVTFVFSPSSDE